MRHLPPHSLLYDGIVGDVTINGHFFRTYPQFLTCYKNLDHAARTLCITNESGINPKLLSAPLFERVRAELAQYPDSPHRLTYFFLLNHTRRSIGGWFALFYVFGHLPALPYIYYPLLLQSLSLEPRHYLETWMQNECMREMHAVSAAIPSTRNEIPSNLMIELKSEAEARSRFVARHLRIRRDAMRYLPGLARTNRIHRTMSLLGLRNRAHRWSWAPNYLTRFSRFLDWIEDRQAPEFPIKAETVPFLQHHFIHSASIAACRSSTGPERSAG
jgi:hypothetical protein